MLDKKEGPCRMKVANIRYYFDKQAKQCLSFEYGGCRGKFDSFPQTVKTTKTFENILKVMKTISRLKKNVREYARR